MKEPKTHYRNTRLYVNAGMRFPECYAYAELLDVEKSALPTTGEVNEVTCKHCLRLMERRAREEGRLRQLQLKRQLSA